MRAGVVFAAVAGLALAAAAHAGAPRTGLYGIVLRGPTRPVCETGMVCEAPASGVALVFSRGGGVVRVVTTAHDGRFSLALPPGRYAVRSTRKFLGSGVTPTSVVVRAGRRLRVVFYVDSGIRRAGTAQSAVVATRKV